MHTWNHRLIFEPVDDHHCRYTDEIETDPGLRGVLTRLFIKLMFRHRRWHTLQAMRTSVSGAGEFDQRKCA